MDLSRDGHTRQRVAVPLRLVEEDLRGQTSEGSLCRLFLRTSCPEAVGHVRHIAEARLRVWGAQDDMVNGVLLCLSELLSNVVRHVGAGSSVVMLENGSALRLTVRDSSADLPMAKSADDLAESGRGLLLIDAVASRWGTEPTESGKDVWVEFDRPQLGNQGVLGEVFMRNSA